MKQQVQVFAVQPDGTAKPAGSFEVEASSVDGLKRAARDYLAGAGNKIRSISAGPVRMVAYVERKR